MIEYTHVYPVNDLIEHDTGYGIGDSLCKCNPKYEYDFDENSCLIIHNSIEEIAMENARDKLIIHDTCGLPVELCECPDATVRYDSDNDVFYEV